MTRAARVLLTSLIDFAGTFPPAHLGLAEAVAAYRRARHGAHRAMLGRFVLAATDLDEFERLGGAVGSDGEAWPLTLVGARQSMPAASTLAQVVRRMAGRARVASVEFARLEPGEIGDAMRGVPSGVEAFVEVAPDGDLASVLTRIATAGGRAKVRTGGIVAGAFPAADALLDVMEACREARVAYKATAGLHHALAGSYRLTTAADSPSADMHGFLNVAVASALVFAGADRATARDVLLESRPEAFVFSNSGLQWNGRRLGVDDLEASRRAFFVSFGSCSFSEPMEELLRMGIVAGDDSGAPSAGPGTRA